MYDDYEGSSSLYLAFKGLLTIAILIVFIYVLYKFIKKLRHRKIQFTLTDILKLIWMILSVAILIYWLTLFFPEFSIEAANEKFVELLPFKKGLLGAFTSIVAAILISMFCFLGIGTYFEEPNKQEDKLKNTDTET